MTTHRTLLLAIGVVVVLFSAVWQKYRLVETQAKTRKGTVILGLAVAAFGSVGPSLLRRRGES
ncbi:MAG TPA: hypothetical protein VIM12_03790 [Noviherbaspirillum sp.]|jgi:hypothetical protein|uniref:hypothetical protein n=1 Tax=Noviherbaspirillum sp. TaxID=1926288 RepID=UPI002F94BDA5